MVPRYYRKQFKPIGGVLGSFVIHLRGVRMEYENVTVAVTIDSPKIKLDADENFVPLWSSAVTNSPEARQRRAALLQSFCINRLPMAPSGKSTVNQDDPAKVTRYPRK